VESTQSTGSRGVDHSQVARSLRRIGESFKPRIHPYVAHFGGEWSFKKLYIPTLRTLRGIEPRDLFEKQTRNDYFSEPKLPEIFTGQTLYDEVRSLLLGNLN